MHTHTDTTRYYLALYTVLVVHAIRNCVARLVAESDPLHDLWYSGLDQVGQGSLDSTAVPLGELLSAGHGAVMSAEPTPFTEEGELAGVALDLESYECIDSAGDYRNRYFSGSEGMTDTVEAAMAPVVADKPTDGELDAYRLECEAAQVAREMGAEVEMPEAPEATMYDARWACIKDGHLEEESARKHAESRPVGEGREFGDMAHYAEWRKQRAFRLVRLARMTGAKGRKSLRAGNGNGYRAAHDMLDKLERVTGERYRRAVNTVVTRGKRSGKPEQQWDWFALYLTRDQYTAVKDAVKHERNRLHTAFRG